MRTSKKTAGHRPRNRMRIPDGVQIRNLVLGALTSAGLWAPGVAWTAQFKAAPKVAEEESAGPDTILGLIHVNTAFFIAVGIFAAFWFLFGGGRKAKLGRKDH